MTEGHPDKICDQISDGILDAVLAEDPNGRVACETLVNTGLVVVSGEISTSTYVDIPKIVRRTINEIGYDNGEFGFDGNTCAVITAIDEQSPDIAQGVDEAYEARDRRRRRRRARPVDGAGDQGMMFGYATNETRALMPMPIQIAHTLARRLAEVRKDGDARLPAPRRQDPGHRPLPRRRPGRDRPDPDLDPARRGRRLRGRRSSPTSGST